MLWLNPPGLSLVQQLNRLDGLQSGAGAKQSRSGRGCGCAADERPPTLTMGQLKITSPPPRGGAPRFKICKLRRLHGRVPTERGALKSEDPIKLGRSPKAVPRSTVCSACMGRDTTDHNLKQSHHEHLPKTFLRRSVCQFHWSIYDRKEEIVLQGGHKKG